MVTISPCTKSRERRLFENVPKLIHREDPYFVPPFPGSVSKIFGPKSPFKPHGELFPFIAYKEGKPAGRIAAIVNRSHNEYSKDKVGFFGFFDFTNDFEVAEKLMQAAEAKLREFGLDELRGPYCPSSNDECGLLVDGFEATPFVMMPYNPTYYIGIYDKLGLEKARNLFAFYCSAANSAPERVKKSVDRVKEAHQVTFRNMDLSRLSEELKTIRDLYNSTLCRNWGFFPVTAKDLEHAAEDLKAIADPKMLLMAEKHGQVVGFSLCLPNINEFLWRSRKNSALVRVLRFLWDMKTKRTKELRLATLGVHPDFRKTGIASVFYFEALMRAKGHYQGGELSWVDEDNEILMKSLMVMGAEKTKTYRIFQKPLVI